MSLTEQMTELAKRARSASRDLARLTTAEKDKCLEAMASALERETQAIKSANGVDTETASKMGLSSAMLDRLKLDDKRIAAMAKGLREVAALPDPVGKILDNRTRPNGLKLQKVTTPIGVIVIIYESRPNVTADAASLCFKSGNATILRGGKEALNSNQTIARLMRQRPTATRTPGNGHSRRDFRCPRTGDSMLSPQRWIHLLRISSISTPCLMFMSSKRSWILLCRLSGWCMAAPCRAKFS